jgi:hypothetical protein
MFYAGFRSSASVFLREDFFKRVGQIGFGPDEFDRIDPGTFDG